MQRIQVHSHQPSINPYSQESTTGSLHWCRTIHIIGRQSILPIIGELSLPFISVESLLFTCYSVEADSNSSSFQGIPQVTLTQPSKHLDQSNMQGECHSHCENEGTAMETLNCSSKCSIVKDDLQGAPMTVCWGNVATMGTQLQK